MDDADPWDGLAVPAGLCRYCEHPSLNRTRRGVTYMRCTRAGWDERIPRYPGLPVAECVGFEPRTGS
ncbi:hypothetical protein GCM10020366_65380 [Saccharopolyspora gregorii]|uniref:Uracil-DNA glycosylase n=1 Tax=Saccharopolyspora gregorii TaxID=33914 RepID=A0ABP6S1K3_9PSEU